jgi:hypothetical protein
VRVRLSAHAADGLGLVLQVEQLRPAKDEVRRLAVHSHVGLHGVRVLAPHYVDIGAKYSSCGGVAWCFPAQIGFQPIRRKNCHIIGESFYFGFCFWGEGLHVA